MKLLDIIHRQRIPKPWTEGEKIPWNDPAFSQRMLNEHLSQAHDAASRRFAIIDEHVDWIHTHVLKGKPTRILDLGCGPGLYTSRLANVRANGMNVSILRSRGPRPKRWAWTCTPPCAPPGIRFRCSPITRRP